MKSVMVKLFSLLFFVLLTDVITVQSKTLHQESNRAIKGENQEKIPYLLKKAFRKYARNEQHDELDEYIKSVLETIDHKKPNKNHQKQYVKNNNNNDDDNFNEIKSEFYEKFNKEISEPNHSSYPNQNYEVADANRINNDDDQTYDREAETRKYKPKQVIFIDDDSDNDWYISTDDQKHTSIYEDGKKHANKEFSSENRKYFSDTDDGRDSKLLESVKPKQNNRYGKSFFSGNGKSDIKSIGKSNVHANREKNDKNYQDDNNFDSKINHVGKLIENTPILDHYSPIYSGKNVEANEDSYQVDRSATKKHKKYKKQKKAKNKKEHNVDKLNDNSYSNKKENDSIKAALNNNLMDILNIMNNYDAVISSNKS